MKFMLMIFILLALLSDLCFAAGHPKLPEGEDPMKIVDLHVHVAGTGAGGSGCYVSPRLRRNWRYGIYLKAFGVTRRELDQAGDAIVFQKISEKLAQSDQVSAAVILALDGVVDENGHLDLERTEVYIPNDFVARETAGYSNLLFGASINPYRTDALERLETVKREGAVLLKWLPSIQHIDPADERIVPFYKKLKELDIPLLVHTGYERSFTRARHDVADPRRLELPLSLGVTVIAAHAATTGKSAGEDNMERLLAMMPAHPNLYADISSLTQLNKLGYLSRLLRRPEIRGRLVYGTDFPLINTALVSPWYFPFNLSWRQMRSLSRMTNPWDRDVQLKRALGVPEEAFTEGNRFLKTVLKGKGNETAADVHVMSPAIQSMHSKPRHSRG